MSGSADFIILPAALAVIVPVKVVSTTTKAAVSIAKLGAHTAMAVHEQIRKAQLDRISRTLGKYADRTLPAVSENAEKMLAEAFDAALTAQEAEMERLRAQYEEAPDISRFLSACSAARRKLYADIQQAEQTLSVQTAEAVSRQLNAARMEMERERTGLMDRIQALSADHDAQLACADSAAAEAIAQAKTMLEHMREGTVSSAVQTRIAKIAETIAEAEAQRAQGFGQAAAVSAYAAMGEIVTVLNDRVRAEQQAALLHAHCKAVSQEMRTFSDSLQGMQYTFREMNSGIPAEFEIEDFSIYYCGAREPMLTRLTEIEQLLAQREAASFLPEELSDLLHELLTLQERFSAETTDAFARLRGWLLRNELAETITNEYIEMGFVRMEAAESQTLDPMMSCERILYSAEAGQTVRVLLTMERDDSGVLQPVVHMDEHEEDCGPDTERKRQAQRTEICRKLEQSNFGKKCRAAVTARCRPGTEGKNGIQQGANQ